jgi:hypothetical protein
MKRHMRFLSPLLGSFTCVLLAGVALAQGPMATVRQAVSQDAPVEGPASAMREIDDPHSGTRWLLVKDEKHPGGPGRLMQLGRDDHAGLGGSRLAEAAPIIHAGDRIVVEEHNDVVDAVLEATALGPARERGEFEARLRVGGRIVRVTAIAPGRAGVVAGLAVVTGARP